MLQFTSRRINTLVLESFRDYLLAEDDGWLWLPDRGAVPGEPEEKPPPLRQSFPGRTTPRSRIVRPKIVKPRMIPTTPKTIGPIRYPSFTNPIF